MESHHSTSKSPSIHQIRRFIGQRKDHPSRTEKAPAGECRGHKRCVFPWRVHWAEPDHSGPKAQPTETSCFTSWRESCLIKNDAVPQKVECLNIWLKNMWKIIMFPMFINCHNLGVPNFQTHPKSYICIYIWEYNYVDVWIHVHTYIIIILN